MERRAVPAPRQRSRADRPLSSLNASRAQVIPENDPGSAYGTIASGRPASYLRHMRRRISFITLFFALCLIAVAGWVIEALRWTVTLGGSARQQPVPRTAR